MAVVAREYSELITTVNMLVMMSYNQKKLGHFCNLCLKCFFLNSLKVVESVLCVLTSINSNVDESNLFGPDLLQVCVEILVF